MVRSGLIVVHDTLVGSQDDVTELSRWEDVVDELLEVLELKVESWGDNTALVKSSVEVNDDLAWSSIINDLEFVDVSVLLHLSEELDNDLGHWSDENLKYWVNKISDKEKKPHSASKKSIKLNNDTCQNTHRKPADKTK